LGLDGFPVQIQNKNLFLDLHSGDFPDFLPGFSCPEKPMAECHLQLQ